MTDSNRDDDAPTPPREPWLDEAHIDQLCLDPNSFRLIGLPDYRPVPAEQACDPDVADKALLGLMGEKCEGIEDLLASFESNGYLPSSPIRVRELDGDNYLVLDGNRRVAALQLLAADHRERGRSLDGDPMFESVPIEIQPVDDELQRAKLAILQGSASARRLGPLSRARLVRRVLETEGRSKRGGAYALRISTLELDINRRALALADQYLDSRFGDQLSDARFVLLREAARVKGLLEWLGWDEAKQLATDAEHLALFFSLISDDPDAEPPREAESAEDEGTTAVLNTREDLRLFGKLLADQRALDKLRRTRNLRETYDNSEVVQKDRRKGLISALAEDVDALQLLSITPEERLELEQTLNRLRGLIERLRVQSGEPVLGRQVLYERSDRHFESLHIEGYRGLHGLKLSTLSRINLISGINNSGKTSLLEALYLLVRQNDFDGLIEVVRRRGKIARDALDLEWLANQMPKDVSISGVFQGEAAEVSLRLALEDDATLDRSRYLGTVSISALGDRKRLSSTSRLHKGRDWETHSESGIRWLCPATFSSPFFLNEPQRFAALYARSVESKSKDRIIEFLRGHLIEGLRDIDLVDRQQRFLLSDDAFPIAQDLTSYGEGVQRIFFISLMFAVAANGVLLIDELENAIHTELVGEFARLIHELACRFNVQVFLTSHSKECIDAFVAQTEHPQDFSYHALVPTNTGIEVREFTGPNFARLVEAGDVDLRRAR